MNIRDELSGLISKFQKEASKGGRVDLLALFKDSLILFEKMKDVLSRCSEEEKKEVFQVMNELHQFLVSESRKIAERSGLSEEQIMRFAENPDNFSAGQWKALEVIKNKLGETAKEMSNLIKPNAERQKAPKPSAAKRPKVSKKDRWLRS
ncbi:MAG: hypothetical protein EBZ47_02210 [Chlamydiae bacterium]|nr:hypothetical protein [Chlamydiota bacterium]